MTCSSEKVGYPSKALATHALYHSQSVKKSGQDAPVRVYRCEECGYWHLTKRKDRDESKNIIKDAIVAILRSFNNGTS